MTVERPDTRAAGLPAEQRLLLACLEPAMDRACGERLRRLASEPIDWESVVALAERHWVAPLVYRSLREQAADLVPEKVLKHLETCYRANVQNSLSLAAHTVRIIDALDEQGVRVIAYKGPVLGETAYGDLCLRQFCDIDLFLRRQDVPAARDILRGMGYEPEYPMSAKEERLYLRCESEYTLRNPATGVMVELHWRVASRPAYRAPADEVPWNALAQVLLLNRPVKTFPAVENLFVLTVHNGAKHHWERLEWIVDVALLVRGLSATDWEDLFGRARRAGVKRVLLLGLSLTRNLLDAGLPPKVCNEIARDRAIPQLEREVVDRLFAADAQPPGRRDHFLFSLRARGGIGGKLSYCAAQLTASTPEDRRVLPLPEVLAPLYGIIRLVRWLRP